MKDSFCYKQQQYLWNFNFDSKIEIMKFLKEVLWLPLSLAYINRPPMQPMEKSLGPDGEQSTDGIHKLKK